MAKMIRNPKEQVIERLLSVSYVDMSLVNLIFGDFSKAPVYAGEEFEIKTFVESDRVGTTGDFFASSTRVRHEDGTTSFKFKLPQFHESKAISPDDKIIRDGFEAKTPEEQRDYQQKMARLQPYSVLERRRQLLAVKMGYDLLSTGEIKHHNGTIKMGLPAPTILTGTTDAWSDTANSDPIKQIVEAWEDFPNRIVTTAGGKKVGAGVRPDALILDRKAKNLFLAHPKVGQSSYNPDYPRAFARAFGADKDSKKLSDDLLFLGYIEEINLPVYYSIGVLSNIGGNESKLIGDNTAMFATFHKNNPSVAGWIYGQIPFVSVNGNDTKMTAQWQSKRIRTYSTVNDAQTMAEIAMMSAFAPYIKFPDVFQRWVVD
jgi:hypothetical protein